MSHSSYTKDNSFMLAASRQSSSTLDLMVDSTSTNLTFKTKHVYLMYIRTMRNDPEVIIDQSGDEAVSRTGRSQSSGISRDGDHPC